MRLSSVHSHSLSDIIKTVKRGNTIDSVTATADTIKKNAVLEMSSNNVREATSDQTDVVGVAVQAVDSGGECVLDFGEVEVLAGSPFSVLDLLTTRTGGYVGKTISSQVTMVDTEAGGDFANQPAGDSVEVVSDDAGDTTQTATIYGTITGRTDEITSETVSLNGTTVVTTEIDSWQTIVGVELSASCDGTVTFHKASTDQTITTITTTNTSKGIIKSTNTNAYGDIPRVVASNTSTKKIGIMGTGLDGSAISDVTALTNNTEKDVGTTEYATITKFFIGDVESNRDASLLTAEADTNSIGRAMEAATDGGQIIKAYIPMSLS